MTTFDALYAFLRTHYKHDRFEGRNDDIWGTDYSQRIARSHMADLERHGRGIISRHEARIGEAVSFDADLNIINAIPAPA